MTVKNLTTSYKIIKILKLMTEKPVSINKILDTFNKENIFVNKETISKYFKTLRKAGCNLQKRNNKYYINYPILNLEHSEFQALANFQKTVKDLTSKEDYKIFLGFIDKLFTLINEEDVLKYKHFVENVDNNWSAKIAEKYKEKIQKISQFMGENPQKLKIIYNCKPFFITPLKFIYHKTSVSLLGYDNKENLCVNFTLKNIENIENLPSKSANINFGLATTFKISQRLKDTYTLREGEVAVNYKDYIIVTNKNQDKTELFNRLLKYGKCCEILYPLSDRKKFTNMVENLLEKIV